MFSPDLETGTALWPEVWPITKIKRKKRRIRQY